MRASNVVCFRVKAGSEQKFIDARREVRGGLAGFRGGALLETGERTRCMIGGGLGVTDPKWGEVVVELPGGR